MTRITQWWSKSVAGNTEHNGGTIVNLVLAFINRIGRINILTTIIDYGKLQLEQVKNKRTKLHTTEVDDDWRDSA